MAKTKPETALAEPTAGGRYKRDASGALITVHQTKPAEGRTKNSLNEAERRLAEEGATPATPAGVPGDAQE